MKCPYCDYEDGWNGEKLENVDGKEGTFYRLPIQAERSYYYSDRKAVLGCPSCKKMFLEI